jgi:DNA-binding transcriptional MerR regulator
MTRTIKDAADHTGLTVHTIRYYEKEGLLSYLPRDTQGRRNFDDSDLDWLGYLNCLRLTGMPIAVMRQIAELQAQGDATIPERRRILETYRQDLVLKLDQIHSALDRLDHKIEWYAKKEKESGALAGQR